ncbi:NADPH:quinone reductase-like Zn-dependent oxidoreductase [Amycolatopsis sulphurea]|uniref:NADPH:quinone reductase-like Zn-dependent oxidoreductase n=1 Tax=Amycolatopsis sulphurea TaxID=76022 RepID=A0A2A9G1B7_9PSEU|nr:NADP-dependent oxidoreductase [Amycolatopsis sulphurea]PFG56590.1 NADPH:quinone reductase-like Zn-dependent oxidoreductase [Amycolatopsis sulphurea]
MRAIGLTEYGGPEVLQVLELPDPVPGTGEVRIRVHAAAVNPADMLLRSGVTHERFEGRPGPYIPGMDAAGVVDAIGPDTETTLQPGDAVIALVRPYRTHGGAYAESIVVPAESVVPMPSGVDFAAASTLLMNALTARIGLDLLAIPPGGTVAVTGAAGAFGGYAVQLAKSDGLRVLADATPADTQLVSGLGADEVVARGDDVAGRFRALAPDGVDGLLDGAMLHELAVPAIRDDGGIAVIRGWAGPAGRGIRVHPVWVTESATDHARLLRLRDQAEAGDLTLRVADILPAAAAAQAHRRLAEGGVRGRLVLDFTA